MDGGNHSIIDLPSRCETGTASSRFDAGSVLRRFRATFRTWLKRHRDRQALSRLDDRLLRDIGLTRDEAERQWAKPFWRA